MGGSFSLGRVFGIPLQLHYSWFIIFALVTISLSFYFFPEEYPLWQRVMGGLMTSLLFFASVFAHELAHSVIAIRNGIPVKSITLFIFGGVASIGREATRPLTELVMAIAGPLCSLIISGIFWLICYLIWGDIRLIYPNPIMWLAFINMVLALFNLIPGFPLDGGRVFRAILWQVTGNYRKATRTASLTGRGIAYLFIFGGIVMLFTLDLFGGIWLAFIGWFLNNAATQSYRQAELRSALQGFVARDVMIADCPTISPAVTLRELVQDQLLPSGHNYFLVAEEGRLKGVITLSNIRAVPQQRWDITSISEAMTLLENLVTVHPEEDAAGILEKMDEHDINQMPVVKEGAVVGVIARDNLLRFLRLRSELGM